MGQTETWPIVLLVELQKWADMLEKDPNSDALWIGLCAKVEAHNITTQRANEIFEDFKWGIIESIQAEKEKPEKEPAWDIKCSGDKIGLLLA